MSRINTANIQNQAIIIQPVVIPCTAQRPILLSNAGRPPQVVRENTCGRMNYLSGLKYIKPPTTKCMIQVNVKVIEVEYANSNQHMPVSTPSKRNGKFSNSLLNNSSGPKPFTPIIEGRPEQSNARFNFDRNLMAARADIRAASKKHQINYDGLIKTLVSSTSKLTPENLITSLKKKLHQHTTPVACLNAGVGADQFTPKVSSIHKLMAKQAAVLASIRGIKKNREVPGMLANPNHGLATPVSTVTANLAMNSAIKKDKLMSIDESIKEHTSSTKHNTSVSADLIDISANKQLEIGKKLIASKGILRPNRIIETVNPVDVASIKKDPLTVRFIPKQSTLDTLDTLNADSIDSAMKSWQSHESLDTMKRKAQTIRSDFSTKMALKAAMQEPMTDQLVPKQSTLNTLDTSSNEAAMKSLISQPATASTAGIEKKMCSELATSNLLKAVIPTATPATKTITITPMENRVDVANPTGMLHIAPMDNTVDVTMPKGALDISKMLNIVDVKESEGLKTASMLNSLGVTNSAGIDRVSMANIVNIKNTVNMNKSAASNNVDTSNQAGGNNTVAMLNNARANSVGSMSNKVTLA